jgi:N-acetylglutamate synthase-like GNAT family acetyltransferase
VALGGQLELREFALDLKLLGAYGLEAVMVVPAVAGLAAPVVEEMSAEASVFERVEVGGDGMLGARVVVDTVLASWRRGRVPVVVAPDPSGDESPTPAQRWAGRIAMATGARRLLLAVPPVQIEGRGGQLTVAEAEQIDDPPWSFVVERVREGVPGVVVLPGRAGCLFEELFTHHGAGVLVGDALAEEVRGAVPADSADIELLMKADIERGLIRPASDAELRRTIDQHLVYTIDGLVVATARLVPWGESAELSRFGTLLRYRGRGRARRLAEALLTRARADGHSSAFALSTNERMWQFFESLGFVEAPREGLPARWREGYDLDRPSRAFTRTL